MQDNMKYYILYKILMYTQRFLAEMGLMPKKCIIAMFHFC